MSIEDEVMDRSAETVSDAGSFADKAARAAKPSASTIGRLGAAVSAARLATRVVPAGWQLLKRNPLAFGLIVAGVALAVYSMRPMRPAAHL